MSIVRNMVVPGWPRFVPGLLLCMVFAFVVMNVDHLLSAYHKADVASEILPKLGTSLATAVTAGDEKRASSLRKKLEKQNKALAKVNGKVGDRWSWATFMYQTLQFKYVAMLLIGGILIRNIFGVSALFLPGVAIARPLIKPGIIILGVHYVWSDVIKVGGTGLVLAAVFIFGTAIVVMSGGLSAGEDVNQRDIEFFETEIRPLLVKHCIACHGPSAIRGGDSRTRASGS